MQQPRRIAAALQQKLSHSHLALGGTKAMRRSPCLSKQNRAEAQLRAEAQVQGGQYVRAVNINLHSMRLVLASI